MLVLVDTNVVLRVVEPLHPRHAQAAAALRDLSRGGYTLCLLPQVQYEFWVAATRPVAVNGLGMTPAEAEAELQKLGPPLFRVFRDERAIYDRWRELVARYDVRGKQAHDARLVAAMQRHDLAHILSFNAADFSRYPDIAALDPAQTATA